MRPLTSISTRRQLALVVVAMTAITIAATWPVATDPGHLSLVRPTENDFRLNNYFIFWGAHSLATNPLELHHTNMFHPERYTFAYADMLLAQSLVMLPVIRLFENPVLTFNLLLMAGFVIGGVGFFVLARRITGHPSVAFLGALLWVFNPVHFTRYQQIQLIGDHWLPWMCFALWQWLDPQEGADADSGRRLRWAVAAAVFFCLNALSGSHLAVFGALIGGIVIAWFLVARRSWNDPAFVRGLALFSAISIIVLAPVFFPYVLVEENLAGTRAETLDLPNASLRPLEAATARSQFYLWLDQATGWPSNVLNPDGRELRAHGFPGLVTLALAFAAFFVAPAAMRPALRLWSLAFAILLFFALGTYGAYAIGGDLPLLRLIRVPSRFLQPAVFALAMMATIGAAGVCQRLPRPGRATTVLVALAALFAVEANFAPLRTWEYAHQPRQLNEFLAEQSGDFAVLEVPVDPFGYAINARQVFNSIFHWKRLLVGYSGYQSQDNIDLLRRVRDTFPADECIDELQELEVRFVVVLEDRVDEELLSAVEAQPRLVPAWRHESWLVYRVDDAGE